MSKSIFTLLALLTLTLTACSKSDKPGGAAATEAAHTHGEWWCAEHGMPEEVCVQCDPKLAADFKAKGDWCVKHEIPDSECFVCHPENEAKFAAMYEAKYGKAPPKREAETK